MDGASAFGLAMLFARRKWSDIEHVRMLVTELETFITSLVETTSRRLMLVGVALVGLLTNGTYVHDWNKLNSSIEGWELV